MSDALPLCGGITESAKEKFNNKFVAYKLLEILFEEGLINFATYKKIEEERKARIKDKATKNK